MSEKSLRSTGTLQFHRACTGIIRIGDYIDLRLSMRVIRLHVDVDTAVIIFQSGDRRNVIAVIGDIGISDIEPSSDVGIGLFTVFIQRIDLDFFK